MKQRKLLWVIIPLYLLTLLCIAVYLYTELQPRVLLNPLGRLALMGVFCICSYIAGRLLCRLPRVKTERIMKISFLAYFLCYIGILLTFTLFDPMFGRHSRLFSFFADPAIRSHYLENSFNIVPFRTIAEYFREAFSGGMNISIIATNLLGNFVALMPMALFLPLFFGKCRKLLPFLIAVLLSVTLIELLQMILVTGTCDIDDLILNTAGACFMFFVLKIKPVQRLLKKLITIQ